MRASVTRADGRTVRRLATWISPALDEALDAFCYWERREKAEVIAAALHDYMTRQRKEPPR